MQVNNKENKRRIYKTTTTKRESVRGGSGKKERDAT